MQSIGNIASLGEAFVGENLKDEKLLASKYETNLIADLIDEKSYKQATSMMNLAGLSKDLQEVAIKAAGIKIPANQAAQAVTGLGKTSSAIDGLKLVFQGLWGVIKGHPIISTISAITAAIGIGKAIYDKFHKSQEELIKDGENAQNTIAETFSDFKTGQNSLRSLASTYSDSTEEIKTQEDAITSLADSYTKLHRGVNSNSNENITLPTEDYQGYLDMSNQLAESFPQLVSGYDAQGNAILNLSNNADKAAASIRDLYSAQQLSAHFEIGDNLQTMYDGVIASSEKFAEEKNELITKKVLNKNAIETIDEVMQNLSLDFEYKNPDSDFHQIEIKDTGEESSKIKDIILEELKKDKDFSKRGLGIIGERSTEGADGEEIVYEVINFAPELLEDSENTRKQIYNKLENLRTEYVIGVNETTKKINSADLQYQDDWKKVSAQIGEYIQTAESFTNLPADIQSAFITNMQDMDLSKLQDENYGGDVKRFVYGEFIEPISKMGPEVQEKISEALKLSPDDKTPAEYKKAIEDIISDAFSGIEGTEEFQDTLYKALGFEKIISESEDTASRLTQIFSNSADRIADMTNEEMEFILNLRDEGFTGSLDECIEEYERVKSIVEEPLDLTARENFKAYEAAKESKNAGYNYDTMNADFKAFKELYDSGLKGVDEYETYAKYLTPFGTDDESSVAAALEKAGRYFVEDSKDPSGIINFLNDLTQASNKSGTALATLNEATGQYSINIEDFKEASKTMGMGSDFFLDMLDKTKDYGFYADFFTTTEGGLDTVSNLYEELGNATKAYYELEAQGADNSILQAKLDEIEQLEERAKTARDSLDSLYNEKPEENTSQRQAALAEIDSYMRQRNALILDNDMNKVNKTRQLNDLAGLIESAADNAGIVLGENWRIEGLAPEIQDEIQAALDGSSISEKFSEEIKAGIQSGLDGSDPEVASYLEVIKNATPEELGQITFGDGSYTPGIENIEMAMDGLLEKFNLTQEQAKGLVEILKSLGIIDAEVEVHTKNPEAPVNEVQEYATEKEVVITVSNESEISTAMDEIGSYKDKNVNISVQYEEGSVDPVALNQQIHELQESTGINIAVEAIDTSLLEEEKEKIEEDTTQMGIDADTSAAEQKFNDLCNLINTSRPNVTVGLNNTLPGDIQASIDSRTYTATVQAIVGGYVPPDKRAHGTPFIQSARFNDGIVGRAYSGGGTVGEPKDTDALVGELGPELVVNFATLCSNTFDKFYLIAGKPLETIMLQRNDEKCIYVNA